MGMRVRLIDIDSKIPNLALMQLSTYHKNLGDEVGFDVENPDLVYASCIFDKNAEVARGVSTMYPEAEVILGGSGIDIQSKIPEPAQKIKPDYTLYPSVDYDIGFTTRGCIRKCPFCVVPQKEGKIHRWQHISEFHEEGHKEVLLLDNNLYADKDWFFQNTDYLLEHNLRVNICQGMDIRILTEEVAERLAQIKHKNNLLRFAWDNPKDEERVFAGLELLKNAGVKSRNIQFYILTGFNSTFEQDKYRCEKLREAGALCFVMQYRPNEQTRRLARWANKRWIYYSVPFSEYNPNYKRNTT
jgi:hypothetical protein